MIKVIITMAVGAAALFGVAAAEAANDTTGAKARTEGHKSSTGSSQHRHHDDAQGRHLHEENDTTGAKARTEGHKSSTGSQHRHHDDAQGRHLHEEEF
jgi:hypothetical protein